MYAKRSPEAALTASAAARNRRSRRMPGTDPARPGTDVCSDAGRAGSPSGRGPRPVRTPGHSRPTPRRSTASPRHSIIGRRWKAPRWARFRRPASSSKRPVPSRSRRSGRGPWRAITRPEAPLSPIRKRAAIKVEIDRDRPQKIDASANPMQPTISGRRRPARSLIGPRINWPRANPARKTDRVSGIVPAATLSSRSILGNAGRYILIASGENAVTAPSRTTSRALGAFNVVASSGVPCREAIPGTAVEFTRSGRESVSHMEHLPARFTGFEPNYAWAVIKNSIDRLFSITACS